MAGGDQPDRGAVCRQSGDRHRAIRAGACVNRPVGRDLGRWRHGHQDHRRGRRVAILADGTWVGVSFATVSGADGALLRPTGPYAVPTRGFTTGYEQRVMSSDSGFGGGLNAPWYRVVAIPDAPYGGTAERDYACVLPALLDAAKSRRPFVVGWLSRGGGTPLELFTNAGPLPAPPAWPPAGGSGGSSPRVGTAGGSGGRPSGQAQRGVPGDRPPGQALRRAPSSRVGRGAYSRQKLARRRIPTARLGSSWLGWLPR